MDVRVSRFWLGLVLAAFAAGTVQADEPPDPRAEAVVAHGRLVGKVWERGTIGKVGAARIVTSTAEVFADDEGAFSIDLPPGEMEVVIVADGYETMRVKEKIVAGQGVTVEYRLVAKGTKKRYESTVRGEGRHEGQHFTLRDEELQKMPGGLGDPFRVLGALPGVAMPLPLLPYYVVRGASPGTNGFFLDGMRVPQLFHFLAGGGVVHGRLVERLDFYPGAYDVSFGRYAGGIVDAETRPARSDGHHGEVELRLYDVSALLEFKLPKGVRLEIAGHYGYPSFIIGLINDKIGLQYGDYQLRLDWRGLTIEALGSYDDLRIDPALFFGAGAGDRGVPDNLRLTFHRVQVRERERIGRVELEAAIVGGIDEMSSFGGTGVRKLSLGWRLFVTSKWKRFRLRAGTDGELSRFTAENFAGASDQAAAPDQWGDLTGGRNGIVAGAYAEGQVDIVPGRLQATLGGRVDVYHAGVVTLLGIDPRLNLKAKLLPWLGIDAGVGLYQQPPSFPVALPGIDTYALQLGLQRAVQSAVGIEAKLPQGFELKLSGYYQRYYNVNDVVLDLGAAVCTAAPPESLTGVPAVVTRQIDGQSYGMELLLRRTVGRVTGWVAYTLSRSERVYSCGLRPSDFDQAHLLNIVVQARLPWKLMLGARLYVATGRPVTVLQSNDGSGTTRNNSRLGDFVEVDLRLDREWQFRRWSLGVFLEVLNLTFSQSDFGVTYPVIDGIRRFDMPAINGFRWVLPSIGIRGRY